jgi:flavin-binding protein dodecin
MNHTYLKTQIVGTSDKGVTDAIQHGLDRAAQTLRRLDWFEVTEIRGQVADGEIREFQVTMKVGFRLEDADQL